RGARRPRSPGADALAGARRAALRGAPGGGRHDRGARRRDHGVGPAPQGARGGRREDGGRLGAGMSAPRKFLLVGLTGGIATGKSTVSKMFRELGAEIIDAD